MFHQQKNVFTSLSHNGFGSSIALLFSQLLMVGVEKKCVYKRKFVLLAKASSGEIFAHFNNYQHSL